MVVLFIRFLIDFKSKAADPVWKGYLYAIALFVTVMLQTLIESHSAYIMSVASIRVRTSIIAAIYQKSLKISNSARKKSTVGEIMNLMAVDSQKIMDLIPYFNFIWTSPLKIIITLYFLWNKLGPAVLSGLAVLIFSTPVHAVLTKKFGKFQTKQMKYKDERVKSTNEVLSGIKVLKFYAWEPSIESQILLIRNKEISIFKKIAYIIASMIFTFRCVPFLVSCKIVVTIFVIKLVFLIFIFTYLGFFSMLRYICTNR